MTTDCKPQLGCASTEELLTEIETRMRLAIRGSNNLGMSGHWDLRDAVLIAKHVLPRMDLEYRTVEGS